MKKILSLLMAFVFAILLANNPEINQHQNFNLINKIDHQLSKEGNIFKKTLKNGLTVLVKPTENLTNVAIELWYKVGSKDEQTDEKGLAHLLEHTIFKGTEQLLSETDIYAVTHTLSGYCNAITSYDYTKYIFELPERHWKEALPILADCMSNCTLKEDLLNSEFKAVIQELKMYRDNYERTTIQEMISNIFADHPYHYPIVGFKQDIWKITSQKLYNFYKKNYIPNNAALIIVGNIDPKEAFDQAEKYFSNIKPDFSYKKKEFYFNKDITAKSITLYRDISSAKVFLGFIVPGIKEHNHSILNIISHLLFNTKSSRLYHKLKEELQLITNIESFNIELLDHDIFFIAFEPKEINKTDNIIDIIHQEIRSIIKNGIKDKELKKIINCLKMSYYNLLTNNSEQAHLIGKAFLSDQNENYFFDYYNQKPENIELEVRKLLSMYFRPSIMHRGYLMPISEDEKQNWLKLQEQSDEEDTRALNCRIRTSELEPCKYANNIKSKPISSYDFPKPNVYTMKNGMKVLYHHNKTAPVINLSIDLKANSDYEPEEMPGLYRFMTNVLIKGTQDYTFNEIANELESIGSSLSISPGHINMSMMSCELEKNLNILTQILTKPKFDNGEIEKIRDLILNDIKNYWDEPNNIATDIIYKKIYKNHPFSKDSFGTTDSIKKITRDDLIDAYKKYITPKGAALAISGDLSNIDIITILENTLGSWDGPEIEDIEYPTIQNVVVENIDYHLNRDQVVLCYAGLSIDINHEDHDKLKIFNQIFSQGQENKLFSLREKTGLFYTIFGSLTYHSCLQPGLVLISTILSKDKLIEAENLISNYIDNVVDSITQEEVQKAKDAIISSWINFYSTNQEIISTFLYLDSFELPYDYFNSNRIEKLRKITLEEIKIAAKKLLQKQNLIKVRVGRIN